MRAVSAKGAIGKTYIMLKNGYKIIRKDEFKEMTWSGGTVLELFIYPENAEFKDRDFIFQVSTATVDLKKSNFTLYENYNRIIMTLDNEIILTHNDKEKITLSKYKPHSFYGGDRTTSQGKASDFNLIINKSEGSGEMTGMSLARGSIVHPRKSNKTFYKEFEIFFCAKGRLMFNFEGVKHVINQGEIVIIDHNVTGINYLFSNEDIQMCDVIITMAKIKRKDHD